MGKETGRRIVWLTGVASLVLFTAIVWFLMPLNPGALTLQFAFTPKAFAEIIHLWSEEDLLRYRVHLPFDFLLLLSYGTFGYLLGRRTALFAPVPAGVRSWATWALPVAAALDATENLLHWWLTEVPRFGAILPYQLSATCSALKWSILFAYALTALYVLAKEQEAGGRLPSD